MKSISTYILTLSISLVFFSCESDLKKITFSETEAIGAVLEDLSETTYILESRNSEDTAFTLKWEAPVLSYQAAINNNIEIDLKDSNFTYATTIASLTNDITKEDIIVGSLNTFILRVLRSHDMEEDLGEHDYEIRIRTSISESINPIYSNSLYITVTPYSSDIQYPKIYIIGSYCGWGWDTAQSLFSFREDGENYEGFIDFGEEAASGFKITGEMDWSTDHGNWGTDGNAVESEAFSIQLVNDGGSGNIECYSHRFYHFTFNTNNMVLNMTTYFDNIYLVGSDPGIGWDIKTGKFMEFDSIKQCFYIDYTFTSDAEIKFLTDRGAWLGDIGENKLGDGNNIAVRAGSYRIYVDLNNSNNQNYELNTDDFNK